MIVYIVCILAYQYFVVLLTCIASFPLLLSFDTIGTIGMLCLDTLVGTPTWRQAKVQDMRDMKTHQFFSGIPVTEDGKIGSKLLGIVTRRDIDFIGDSSVKLSEVHTLCIPYASLMHMAVLSCCGIISYQYCFTLYHTVSVFCVGVLPVLMGILT